MSELKNNFSLECESKQMKIYRTFIDIKLFQDVMSATKNTTKAKANSKINAIRKLKQNESPVVCFPFLSF